jgi:hypothetical protein
LLFYYPKKAAFGKVLPKSKIYEYGKPTNAIKALFVQQIDSIVWQYKLAAETVGLKETISVPEIQIFCIMLKSGEINTNVLRCIDGAIPFPIVFELHYGDRIKQVAAFKRPSEGDARKWVISDYFNGDWVFADAPRQPLPIVLNLESLYGHLMMALMDCPSRPGENLQDQVSRMLHIQNTRRELKRCETQLRKEKQFNRKVTINAKLRELKQELEGLIQ